MHLPAIFLAGLCAMSDRTQEFSRSYLLCFTGGQIISNVSLIKGHLVRTFRYAASPILIEKLNEAVSVGEPKPFTPRDAQLPAIPGKVRAIIGMRWALPMSGYVSLSSTLL